ncbi:MAG: hypothetical protein CUN55_03265 [Phototrophicales bacterium]|nr:MAG: hypothetical protein CUN55_03265 [Phototrophicales bacterium]
MSRWGLRWIFCWVGVLVTACTQIISPTPASKTEPATPITMFPSSITPQDHSSTPNAHFVTSEPYTSVRATDPSCYEQPNGTLICLGWVWNYTANPIEQVVVDVQLIARQGFVLNKAQVSPDIPVILPQQRIPYRAIFTSVPELSWQAIADVQWQDSSLTGRNTALVLLTPQNIEAQWRGRDYIIKGNFVNSFETSIHLNLIIGTIETQQQLHGLRIKNLELELLPNESYEFELLIAPLDGQQGNIYVSAYGFMIY